MERKFVEKKYAMKRMNNVFFYFQVAAMIKNWPQWRKKRKTTKLVRMNKSNCMRQTKIDIDSE